MKAPENFDQFNRRIGQPGRFLPVSVYRIRAGESNSGQARRRNFYKLILLEKANGAIEYGGKKYPVNNRAFLFTDSRIPYTWLGDRENLRGFVCACTVDFMALQVNGGQRNRFVF